MAGTNNIKARIRKNRNIRTGFCKLMVLILELCIPQQICLNAHDTMVQAGVKQ
jgi:hypothetical protein